MNTPIGLFGLSSRAREVWMRLAIISSAWSLADDALVQRVGQLQHGLDLVLDHPADRNAGPVRDDRGHRLLVDASAGSAASRPAASSSFACSACSSASSWLALAPASAARLGAGAAAAAAAVARRPPRLRACCRCLRPAAPPRAQLARGSRGCGRPAPSRSLQRSSSRASRVCASASAARPRAAAARPRRCRSASSRPMISSSASQRLDAPPAVLDLRRASRAG